MPIIAMICIAITAVVRLIRFFKSGQFARLRDKLKNPEEWKDTGSAGERIYYNMLTDEFKVPEEQILRNVYIPAGNGKTSEIDILVISRRGLFVFECKNYAGNMYGDAKREKWIQYVGGKKSFFYNPIKQNETHVKNLRKFLEKYGDFPIIPVVAVSTRGEWKISGLGEEDRLLGYNCDFQELLDSLPESETVLKFHKQMLAELEPLSRPEQTVREQHIERIKNG